MLKLLLHVGQALLPGHSRARFVAHRPTPPESAAVSAVAAVAPGERLENLARFEGGSATGSKSALRPKSRTAGNWPRNPRWLFRALADGLLLIPLALTAATFTASLDHDTITLGENATLALAFGGATPQSLPSLPSIPNLQVSPAGTSTQMSFNFGSESSSTVTYNFALRPTQPGEYTIPALTANVGGQTLTTQPLKLTVLKPNAPPPQALNSGTELAFLKLAVPRKEIYVGETMNIQLQLYLLNRVQGAGQFQLTAFPADGFNIGKLDDRNAGQRRQIQFGNSIYTVVPWNLTLQAIKAGHFTLGPVTATIVVQLPSPNRRRDPFFEQFGIRDPFGSDLEQKQVVLATEADTMDSLPLPRENVPAGFNGAVGSYSMTASAGPTNVAVGDPITLRVQIAGRGSLDAITLPEQNGWSDFKAYPPTAKVETSDTLGLQGTKTFEQLLVPQNSEIKQLPPISFSFFDPEKKSYRTLTQPAVPLSVKASASAAGPTVLASSKTTQDNTPQTPDIVPNKQRLGTLAQVGPPLIQQPWFLAVQSVPMLAWVSLLAWRKRTERLANNPRLRRQRLVAQIIREGLEQLRQLAAENKSDEFFATLVRLLQEQLGERLDVPANSITEAVIEERLRPLGADDAALNPLQELFQTCNLARYAPITSSQELAALVPRVETVLGQLRKINTGS